MKDFEAIVHTCAKQFERIRRMPAYSPDSSADIVRSERSLEGTLVENSDGGIVT